MKQSALPLFFTLAIFAYYDSESWELLVKNLGTSHQESVTNNAKVVLVK